METQTDHQEFVAMMEKQGRPDMVMHSPSCHTIMYVFGGLVILGLLVQIVIQSKMLRALRKSNRK